jgi:hypothetical protein
VERAILRELQALRRQRVYDAYAHAASDAAFMKDMEVITRAFEPSSSDGFTAVD